jgi:hypothetical protein
MLSDKQRQRDRVGVSLVMRAIGVRGPHHPPGLTSMMAITFSEKGS